MELLTRFGLTFGFRWLHVLGGIMWIGLLYYFNLVQVPAFAAFGDDGKSRNMAIDKIARRALWWFRWSALFTLVTGLLIVGITKDYMKDFLTKNSGQGVAHDAAISLGMIFGITMAANVWMVIWKNQKVVLANAANVLAGNPPDPAAAAAGRSAALASRQNTVFSVSMLFFMVGSAHFFNTSLWTAGPSKAVTFLIIGIVIGTIFELNCLGIIGGKATTNKLLWPYESHKNAIIAAFSMWAVLWILSEILFKK
jgi:uncharacterized membrane protein